MKVVYCIPHLYNAGGMERVLTQKANYLAALPGYELLIVTTELTPDGHPATYFPLDSRIRVVPLAIDFDAGFSLPLWRKWLDHRRKQQVYKQRLRQLLIDEQADVCISLCGKEIEWLAQLDVPCRKIAEIHFAIDYRKQLLMQYHKGFFWSLVGDSLTRQLVRHCRALDQLVVLTDADEKRWRQCGLTRICTIPNPTSIAPHADAPHAKRQVLAVGRLHPQKGFDILLRVWSQVIRKCPGWTLKIVGEGPMRPQLEEQIASLGLQQSVEMNGLSSDIRRDYDESPLLVLSSRYEGLPLALMEAMSCGTCCIAFDCPEGPRELIQDGKTGVLIPPADEAALATALVQRINDPVGSRQLGEQAYAYACRHFAIDTIMSRWRQLLENTK